MRNTNSVRLVFNPFQAAAILALAMLTAGCEAMTREEVRIAVEESALEAQAINSTAGMIEISTNFTIGQGLEQAAASFRDFVRSQIPCAVITLDKNTVSVRFGEKGQTCFWNGRLYTGLAAVTIASVAPGELKVTHTWDQLSDGSITVTGKAEVAWDVNNAERRVSYDFDWTHNNKTRESKGQVKQKLIDPKAGLLASGFEIQGNREWSGEAGSWKLDINNVQVRLQDPVPQKGEYKLTAPSGKSMSMSFNRVDGDTIEITIKSGAREFRFRINRLGGLQDLNS